MSAGKEDDVFLDAEEEITPRRTSRKRRSTAGNSQPPSGTKKARQVKKMPTQRSPNKPEAGGDHRPAGQPPAPREAGDAEAFWGKMTGMLGGLETRLKQETTDVKHQLAQAIGDLGQRLEKAERRLDGFTDEVHKIVDMRLLKLGQFPNLEESGARGAAVAEAVSDHPAQSSGELSGDCPLTYAAMLNKGSLGGAKVTRTRMRSGRREENYWRCRKSLRLRPIINDGGTDLEAVEAFLEEHLKLDRNFMRDAGPMTIRRVPSGPGSKIKNEMIVAFDSVDTRDVVKRAARNLAGKGQEYGVRLELPDHLKSAMGALQSVSYEIKQKFAGAKRNVLFDDSRMDLVLDFAVEEGKPWRRMTSGQAVERKRKSADKAGKFGLEAGEIEELLDDGREELDEEAGAGP